MSASGWLKFINWEPKRIYAVSAYVFTTDQLLKMFALDGAAGGWRGVAEFNLFLNRGFAFSLGHQGVAFWLILAGAFAAVGYAWWRELKGGRRVEAAWLAMAITGGLSNLLDRALRGATVDYLIFFNLSAINLADVIIVAGFLGWLGVSSRRR